MPIAKGDADPAVADGAEKGIAALGMESIQARQRLSHEDRCRPRRRHDVSR